MRIALAILAGAALAACGETGAPDSAAADADIAWTQDFASCGLEMQDRLVWGQAVSGSELEMQQVKYEADDLLLRVWSPNAADLAVEDGVLTGRAAAPAWIAADVTPNRGYMAHLAEGTADLRVEADRFSCASAGGETDADQ